MKTTKYYMIILTLLLIIPIIHASPFLCYQESATTTNQTGIDGNCGLNYSGSYTGNGNWVAYNPPTNLYDGNWSSSQITQNNKVAILYINYSKPSSALNTSLWQLKGKYDGSYYSYNVSINNECWSQPILQFKVQALYNASSYYDSYANWSCYNGSSWNILKYFINGDSTGGSVWEEAMYWNISNYSIPTTPIINYPIVGTKKINNTVLFINYTPSVTDPVLNLSGYNISLTCGDGWFIKTINQTLTSTSYNWTINVTKNDTCGGYYKINVKSKDTLGKESNEDTSEVFYVYDAYLNITAKDNITSGTITNFTITPTGIGYYNATSLTTTTGSVILYLDFNYDLPISITSNNYASETHTINTNIFNNSYQFALYTNNSIYLTITDQITNNLINTNTTSIILRSSTYYNNSNATNGVQTWINLEPNNYTLEISAPGYTTQTYYTTVYDRSTQNINARLLPNTSYINVGVYVKNNLYQILTSSLITIQKQYIGGSWATVNQVSTDVNGYTIIPVTEGLVYRFIITSTGYDTKQFEMALYSALSPYTFVLTQTANGLYVNYYDGVNYYYTPTISVLNQSVYNFSITTYNSSLDIAWTSVSVNGSTTNVTGSPAGGTATKQVDLTSYTGSLNVLYSFYFYNDLDSKYYLYTKPVTYYINSLATNTTTMPEALNNLKDDVDSSVWTTIIAMLIILTIVITLMQLSGNQSLGIVGGIVGLAFFGYIGWMNPIFAIITGLLGGILLFMNRG